MLVRTRVLLSLLVLIILVDMASGAGDTSKAKETIVNVGKTFSHIAKFKDGGSI